MHQCSLRCGYHSWAPVLHRRQHEHAPGLLSPSQDTELLPMQIPGSWARIKSPAHWEVREKQWEQKVTCDLNITHFVWTTTKSCVFSTGIYPTALMPARHLSTSQKSIWSFPTMKNSFFLLKNKIKQKIPFSSPLSSWASLIYFLIVATIASYHYFQHL